MIELREKQCSIFLSIYSCVTPLRAALGFIKIVAGCAVFLSPPSAFSFDPTASSGLFAVSADLKRKGDRINLSKSKSYWLFLLTLVVAFCVFCCCFASSISRRMQQGAIKTKNMTKWIFRFFLPSLLPINYGIITGKRKCN